MPGVVPDLLVAADEVEPLVELLDEPPDLGRVVLQVGVHRENDFTLGRPEPGGQGRRLPAVPSEPEPPDPPFAPVGKRLYHGPRIVAATVIHEDHLGGRPSLAFGFDAL